MDWITAPAPLAYLAVGSGTTILVMAYWERHEEKWLYRRDLLVCWVMTISERRAFYRNQRNGEFAGALIAKQRTIEGAEWVYKEWKDQENSINPRPVYQAMAELYQKFGNDEKALYFAQLNGWERADSEEDFLAPRATEKPE